MSEQAVHYVPIVTTILAVIFSAEIFRRYREHPERLHLLWWALGIAVYGVGTFTEAATTLFGWNEPTFRAWYISGALLGGAPLAQGTVYLLLARRTAHVLTVVMHLMRRGRRIPQDVAVISRDDDTYLQSASPNIARYAVNPTQLARRVSMAVRQLAESGTLPANAIRLMPRFLRGETV